MIYKTTADKFGPCIIRHMRSNRDGMVDIRKLRKVSKPFRVTKADLRRLREIEDQYRSPRG
jgi:hypothetical protein